MRKLILFIVLLSVAGCLYLRAQNTPAKKNYIGFNTVPLWENIAKKDTFSPFTIIYQRILNNNKELIVEADLYFNHQHEGLGSIWQRHFYRTWIYSGINAGYYFIRTIKRFSFACGAGIGYKINHFSLKAENYASGLSSDADGIVREYSVWFNKHYQTMFFSIYSSCRMRFQISPNLRIETEAKLPFQYKINKFWGVEEDHYIDDGKIIKGTYPEELKNDLKVGIVPFYAVNLLLNF